MHCDHDRPTFSTASAEEAAEEDDRAEDEVVEADSHGTHKALMNPAGTAKRAIAKEATNAISHARKHTHKLCSNTCSNCLLPIQQQNWQTCARK